ncbi:HU family DNA-binding protein [Bacteroides eggerthii]|uniref:HU family DNA-binding protein n=2 Tax=Bacteroides eggerthii TaxID=28111 RepID=UPI001C37A40B|nr:HU family DNA-binding protein [Bacteroides eggerthii]MBV3844749.1 HU family DNA-binding protein [Bacteroides eggerthii]MBV3847717.1 HU family DNA-binding protein [Bacteroides eggerthii]MBV3885894.1 HU family DNA-binding protein [Bacteroides eggerthii]MBV3892846.1 HU family DNA-binding protein [Bacteroides eggerthii]MBV3904003.1 HU family DNA-binding protein [Bacteroides eggerthii]
MNEKLNIQDLIDLLAEKHGMSKKNADSFVKEFFQLIEEALEKDKYVKVKGLGAFKLIDVESRESVNVNTGERFEIQGHTKVSFTPEPALKDLINKPFSHFETVVLNDNTVLEDTPVDDSDNEDEENAGQKTEEVTAATPEDIETPKEKTENREAATTFETATSEETMTSEEEKTETPEEAEVMKTDASTESSTMKYFIGIVVFVVLLCAGAIAYLYSPELFDNLSSEPPVEKVVDVGTDKPADNTALADSVAVKDTVTVTEADTASGSPVAEPVTKKPDAPVVARRPDPVNTTPVSQTQKTTAQTQKTTGTAYIPDSTSYTIVGTETTYTIKSGETLTKVALRFYGTKVLYPYIVKHNPAVIKNPNNVPAGTTIKIPKLKKKQ